MFEGLEAEIEGLDIGLDGPELLAAISLWERLGARVCLAVGAFDDHQLWDLEAATSMTAWLRQRATMTSRGAAHLASLAFRLCRLPACAAAAERGRLSAGQVEAIVAGVGEARLDLFAAQEAELVPTLARLSVSQIGRAMAGWRLRADQDAEAPPPEPVRSLHLSATLDDRYVLDGSFDAAGGSVVATALRLATTDDVEAEPARTATERRADALVDVCRHYLDHQRHRGAGRHRPHLNVVVDLDDLHAGRAGRLVDGPELDAPSTAALACDCALHRVVMAGRSAVLNYASATRTIPTPLWNALVVRDQHCRFPGCDRPATWSEGHHVRWFSHGGNTALDNLVLVCSRHHHRLHRPGWGAKLLPDATFEVTDPDGRVRTSHPPRAGPTLSE